MEISSQDFVPGFHTIMVQLFIEARHLDDKRKRLHDRVR